MKPIIAFTGSNSPHSINHQLLLAALRKLPSGSVRLLSLTDFPAPLYGACLEKRIRIPAAIQKLDQILGEAGGFMIASPEHNGLPTAFFKNTIDWLSRIDTRIFRRKPVLLLSTSPGKNGGATHLRVLTDLMPWWGGEVVSSYALPSFDQKYNPASQTITDAAEDEKLTHAVGKLWQAVAEQQRINMHA